MYSIVKNGFNRSLSTVRNAVDSSAACMQRFVGRNKGKITAGIVTLGGGAMGHAQTGSPLDLTATGATIAGYVGGAALIGIGVFSAIYGVRVIIKSFKTVAK